MRIAHLHLMEFDQECDCAGARDPAAPNAFPGETVADSHATAGSADFVSRSRELRAQHINRLL
jgi:hypothetical protein